MPSTKDLDMWKAFKILLVAPNGYGKSIAAASFHKAGPILFQDFDGRMKPIANHYRGVDIKYESYGVDDFRRYLSWIEDIQKKTPDFKTLVTDSLTSLTMTTVMYSLMVKGNSKTDSKTGLPATTWDEINRETVTISKLLEVYKLLYENHGVNIIMTAHPITKTIIGEKEGESTKVESLTCYGNKVGNIVPGYFDEIYRLSVRKVGMEGGQMKRFAITSKTTKDDDIIAKTALPLPAEFDITNGLYDSLMSFKKALS